MGHEDLGANRSEAEGESVSTEERLEHGGVLLADEGKPCVDLEIREPGRMSYAEETKKLDQCEVNSKFIRYAYRR